MVAKRRVAGRLMVADPYSSSSESGRQDAIVAHLLTVFDRDDPEFMGTMMEFGRISLFYGIDLTPEKAEDVIRRIIENNRERDKRRVVMDPTARVGHHDPVVYYMRLGNRIKIGTTTHLSGRFDTIRAEEVMVIEQGNYVLEKRRHRQFAELRTVGEWFRHEEPLVSHIERLQRAAKQATA